MRCKSVGLVHNWESDQSYLTGIETKHLFPTVIYILTCCHEQTTDYVTVQTLGAFILYPRPVETCEVLRRWTHKMFLLSKFCNPLPLNAKVFVFRFAQKKFISSLCKAKRTHHVTKIQNEVRLLSWKRTTWKQRKDFLVSEKALQLIKVISPPVISHSSWHGLVCSRPPSVYNKSLNTKPVPKQEISTYQALQNTMYQTDSLEMNKELIAKSRFFTRQNFLLSAYQALILRFYYWMV